MPHKKNNRGFTLVEIIIVSAITVFLLSLGLFVSFDAYRSSIFRSERMMLVSILERARSLSMNNMYESPHGVCYDGSNKNYIIFRNTCTVGVSLNENIPGSSVVSITGLDTSSNIVLFDQLTGNTAAEKEIVLTDSIRTATVTVSTIGTINW